MLDDVKLVGSVGVREWMKAGGREEGERKNLRAQIGTLRDKIKGESEGGMIAS